MCTPAHIPFNEKNARPKRTCPPGILPCLSNSILLLFGLNRKKNLKNQSQNIINFLFSISDKIIETI